MQGRWKTKLKKLNLFSLCIPLLIFIVSAFMPLKPIVQQALVGLTLIWFQVTAILFLNFWQG